MRKNSILNEQGKIMNILEFDGKRFFRFVMRYIVICSSIIVISSMTTVRPAHATGTVAGFVLPSSCAFNWVDFRGAPHAFSFNGSSSDMVSCLQGAMDSYFGAHVPGKPCVGNPYIVMSANVKSKTFTFENPCWDRSKRPATLPFTYTIKAHRQGVSTHKND